MRAQRVAFAFRLASVSGLIAASLAAAALTTSHAQQQQQQKSGQQQPEASQPANATVSPPAAAPSAQPAATLPPAAATATTVAASANAAGDDRYVVNSDLINLSVTLTDMYGRYVTGLSKEAFSVFDNKEQQEIQFFSDDDAPVSMGVIFDVSGSMGKDKLGRAREALRHFVDTSHDSDEYFLIGFNSRAQLLMDRTRDSDAMLDKLTFVESKGNTALYDACYLGIDRVTRGAHPKRALLVISDGQDNNSRYTFNELRRLLKETDVLIYAIGIVERGSPGSLDVGGQALLEELAAVSGGHAFFPDTAAEMNEIFERIAIELRHQYSIAYRPKNFTNDGKWHKIKVKVAPPRGLPRLFVRSKEGYYATTNPR
ncbi:MAG TPA: VWA domain-containing protein [Pyrinomonadaceae bacterium]|nr:VWA domain-containing protein [Pyrinomonadaceae bacterium]